ncbi:MAG: DUF1080 domain-containing protein [Verrucomicrobiales bacterium]|nr:DUF1080 domain-containing protein [Verrucomicrobiales bacterium]
MKFFRNALLFLAAFFVAGVAIHYGSYQKFGVFIWSKGEEGIVRTEIPEVDRNGVVAGDPDAGGKDPEGTEPNAGKKEKGKGKSQPAKDPNHFVLFNGKDFGDWKKTEFGGEGDVFINEDKAIEFGFGAIMTGIHFGKEPPARSNYELSLEAMKLDGNDFFAAVTFPVKDSHASFVVGGWGGGVVGLSSIDDLDASENETMNIEGFENNKWYKIRIRVTDDDIDIWLDGHQMVDLELKDRKISLRPGDIELCVPIGIASFQTRAQYRNIEWRNIDPNKIEEEPQPSASNEGSAEKKGG